LRADAARNRDHILEVAELHFSEHGVTGSLDGVAKRAGVGAGTLYRHFPTREALLAALLAERNDRLLQRQHEIRAGSTGSSGPGGVVGAAQALQWWLEALVEWAGVFDGLPEPLRAAVSDADSPLATTCQGYVTVTEEFLTDAQREGSALPGVRARDLFLAALAISWVRGAALADEASSRAVAELVRSGWSVSRRVGDDL